MLRSLYSGITGVKNQQAQMDVISNNIANINTPAFKRDQQVFREYLTANEKPPEVIQVPKVPASVESFYDMQGGDKSFVDPIGTYTDHSQGGMRHTGNALDVALASDGFFEVATPNGVRLTRHGSFSLDGNGQLVTKEGMPVLSAAAAGTEPESRVIKTNGETMSIQDNGDVYLGNNLVAKLSVVNVADKDSLQKIGNSLYQFKPNSKPEVTNL